MSEETFGTVAALQFRGTPTQEFEDIVEELDISFRPFGLTRRTLTWDADDIAIIERDSLRLLLGWVPAVAEDRAAFLVMAIGHATSGGNLLVNRETCEFVKEILIEHLSSYLEFDTVFHADATQPVGTELVDTVTEIIDRDFYDPRDDRDRAVNARGFKRDRAYTRDISAERIVTREASERVVTENIADRVLTRDISDRVVTRDISLSEDFVRAHTPKYEKDDEVLDGDILDPQEDTGIHFTSDEASLPKRLTIYTLGATMLIYTPPVGASLLVYSTLRDLIPQENARH